MTPKSHSRTAPAELVGPPTSQCESSNTYENVRPSRSSFGSCVTVRIAPLVPIVIASRSCPVAATPRFASAPSLDASTIGVVSAMPSALATCALANWRCVEVGAGVERRSGVTPASSSARPSQTRSRVSNRPVAVASA
jgi:hypothetical protein